MELFKRLLGHLPGARLRDSARGATLVFQSEGIWLDARVRESPMIEIYIRTIDLCGTKLAFEPTFRKLDVAISTRRGSDGYSYYHDDDIAKAVERASGVATFADDWKSELDGPLAAYWLDDPIRVALQTATRALWDGGMMFPGVITTGYRYGTTNTEISIFRENELEVQHLLTALHAGAAIASRPHRIGKAWLDVARGLGGTTTEDRWDVGGAFAATFERGATALRLDNVLRLHDGDDDTARVATRLRARRLAPDGDAWKMVGHDLPWQLPKLPRMKGVDDVADVSDTWEIAATNPERARTRLRRVAALIDEAAPRAMWAAGDEVTLVWDGLQLDPARLGPGIDLATQMAFEADAAVGPYR